MTAGARRVLTWVAVVETVSLAVLLLNLATVHLAGVAALLGPVHGCAYLIVIALVVSSDVSPRIRLLSVVPAIGALLVLRATAPARHQPAATADTECANPGG